jgi:hypothetical protein
MNAALSTQEIIDSVCFLKPKRSPFPLVRLGGEKDGAYLVPDDLKGITACFSPGVNNFKNFEDELTSKLGIRCHMCDFSSDVEKLRTPLIAGMQTFKKRWLDVDGSEESISLEKWVEELEPNKNEDLLLQMDIEGAEYRNLIGCPESVLQRFRIVILEIHRLGVVRSRNEFAKELGPLLRKLDKQFVCVHAHPNNCCGEFMLPGSTMNMPNVIEVTLLRRDRIERTRTAYVPSLPHPLDISCNVRRNPPLFLNAEWSEGGVRTSDSRIKILEDKLDYYIWRDKQKESDAERMILTFNRAFQEVANRVASLDSVGVDSAMKEVAYGKKFFLSSSYDSNPREGNISSKSPFFFHTGFGRDQYITIDLGTNYRLDSLMVVNRSDGNKERGRCLFYVTHSVGVPDLEHGLPLFINRSFWEGDSNTSVTPLGSVVARYLSIFSPEYTALHFRSVQILGTPV